MSIVSSERTNDAARGIAANVDRLEKLFDRLYADTFGMMKDTVSDMRRHIWPDQERVKESVIEAERLADLKISELRRELVDEVKTVIQRQAGTDKRTLQSLTQQFSSIVERAIDRSRNVDVEVREETVREKILARLQELRRANTPVIAGELVTDDRLAALGASAVILELEKMRDEGVISYPDKYLRPQSVIAPVEGIKQ